MSYLKKWFDKGDGLCQFHGISRWGKYSYKKEKDNYDRASAPCFSDSKI